MYCYATRLETLFSVAREGYRLGAVAELGLAPVFLAACLSYHAFIGKARLPLRVAAYAALALSLLLAGILIAATVVEFKSLAALEESLMFRTVSGEVEGLSETPSLGWRTESFSVSGVRFSYSAFHYTHAFRTPRSLGGPLREGLPVRIRYGSFPFGNLIVRIEAPRGSASRAAGLHAFVCRHHRPIFLWLLGMAFLLLAATGRLLRPYRLEELRFRESLVGGRSLKNAVTRWAPASFCLDVAVAGDTLYVRAAFPFNLPPLPGIFDLDHAIPLERIQSAGKKPTLLSGKVRIRFLHLNGLPRILELWLGRPDELLGALKSRQHS